MDSSWLAGPLAGRLFKARAVRHGAVSVIDKVESRYPKIEQSALFVTTQWWLIVCGGLTRRLGFSKPINGQHEHTLKLNNRV
jgi:hypothetical protein